MQYVGMMKTRKYKSKYRLGQKPKIPADFRLYDVPGRDGILIHIGNYAAGKKVDTKGCILPGTYFTDINQDGYTDVAGAGDAMKKLLVVLPFEFELTIMS